MIVTGPATLGPLHSLNGTVGIWGQGLVWMGAKPI